MKQSVYLDSTIPSYLFDERESIKTYIEITRKWWEEERGNFALWISDESIIELSQGEYPNKDKLMACVAAIQVLPPDEHVFEVAQVYLDNYLMPRSLTGDAIHLAATYLRRDTIKAYPFALSLSKGERVSRSWFDKLTTNGLTCPALS